MATRSLHGWREIGLAYDAALTGLDIVTWLDPADPEVRAAGDATREILTRLGAKPFLARLDAALERRSPAEVSEGAALPETSTV